MKPHISSHSAGLLILAFSFSSFSAADPEVVSEMIIETGPNHRVIESVIVDPEDGQEKVQRHTVLQGGLNYLTSQGQWVESDPTLRPAPGGAVADRLQARIAFSTQLNEQGAVSISQEGVELRSAPLALVLFDSLNGDEILLGVVRDTVGELVGANQILYRDVFGSGDHGGIEADILYTVRTDGMSQDLLLRTAVDLDVVRDQTAWNISSVTGNWPGARRAPCRNGIWPEATETTEQCSWPQPGRSRGRRR